MAAGIIGLGGYLPAGVLTNDELAQRFDVTPQWIFERTGIRQRHVVAADQRCSDLAVEAARRALADAQTAPDALSLVILATSTPDQLSPASAARVQHALGATRAGSFDLSAACSGFMYALTLACQLVDSGQHERILVVGAEVSSRIVDDNDRDTAILFGDGAGAVVVGQLPAGYGLIASDLGSDGALYDAVGASYGDCGDHGGRPVMHMDGWQVFGFAMRVIGDSMRRLAQHAGIALAEIDLFVPHQANLRIIEAGARRIDLPLEKTVVSVETHGNTSAASIPLALGEARNAGRIKDGDLVALIGFGGGLSWASGLLRWHGGQSGQRSTQEQG
jgi:3-oxoacyl-[acyl-carrier-protein] synthase-3